MEICSNQLPYRRTLCTANSSRSSERRKPNWPRTCLGRIGGSNGAMFTGLNQAWTDDNIEDPGLNAFKKPQKTWGTMVSPIVSPQEILFSLDPPISSRQYGKDWKMPSSWVLEERDLSPESLPSGRTARLRRAPAAHWAASWPLIFLFYYNLWA